MDNLTRLSNVQSEKSVMPNLVPQMSNEAINAVNNDFIKHPQQYPLEIKRLRRWPWSAKTVELPKATIGLSVQSDRYIATNTQVQVSIPLRGEAQSFTGTVVLVKELKKGFEIGLWLASNEDEARARIVEKICYAECDLSHRTGDQEAEASQHGINTTNDDGWFGLTGKPGTLNLGH